MAYGSGSWSKFDYARWSAAALAHLTLSQRDTVGLVVFDGDARSKVPPGNGAPQRQAILSTLEQLDRIIASSKTTAAGGPRAVELATATGGPEATSNELAILSAALNNLFSYSARLDDAALAQFLTALSTQCFAGLAHEATSKEKLERPGAASPPRFPRSGTAPTAVSRSVVCAMRALR